MIGNNEHGRGRRIRIAAWAIAALILMLPLVAMQFTDEVAWNVVDFAVAAVLLIGVGLGFEAALKRASDSTYRAAAALALAAVFLLFWLSLAVGIIGREGNPANLMYFGVLAIAIGGAVLVRLRPYGMARVLGATAVAQGLVAVIALIAGLGAPASGPLEIVLLNGFFVALFGGSAWLFQRAARQQDSLGVA